MPGFQLPATVKRYSRSFTNPYAASGGLPAGAPSRSLSQPGGTVVAPPVNAPAFKPYQGVPVPPRVAPLPSGPKTFDQAFGPKAPPLVSSTVYRDTSGDANTALRQGLISEVRANLSPQAWANAGRPASEWKAESARTIGELDQWKQGKLAQIEAAFNNGQMNAAEYRVAIERVGRDYDAQKAQALVAARTGRANEGRVAATATAGALSGLLSQVPELRFGGIANPDPDMPYSGAYRPRGPAMPAMTPGGTGEWQNETSGMGGAMTPAAQLADTLRAQGYANWAAVPIEDRQKLLQANPGLVALLRKYGVL